MSKKVYVGNLPFSVTNDKLKEIFAVYGEVSEALVIVNKFSGRSKGFGFVTFTNDVEGEKAIAEMNGKEIEGRKLTVNEATPFNPDAKPRRESGGFGGPRRFGGDRRGGRGFGGPRRFGNKKDDSEDSSEDSDDSGDEQF